MELGTVKWFDKAKGYGCISRNGEDILVPISAIQASGFTRLKPGETVRFDLVDGPKGLPTRINKLYSGFDLAEPGLETSRTPGDHAMLRSIQKKLGVRATLKSDADLVTLVEERIPVAAISSLMENGILEKEIYSVVIPRRTLQHRRARKEKLSCEESDRAVRLARLASLTEKVFGQQEAGMHWLRAPKKRFRGRTPMDMIATEAGSRLVEEALYQIDEGMAA